ncbi:MAG: T9SS type A sorting domain-containing protein [Bacteroidota bacterium]
MAKRRVLSMRYRLPKENLRRLTRSLLFIIASCAFCLNTRAQGFNNRYIDVRPAMQYAGLSLKDSDFYTIGVTTRMTAPYIPKVMWSKISGEGLLQSYFVYEDSNYNEYGAFLNALVEENDSIVKVLGYVADTINVYPVLRTINYAGELKRATIYPDSTTDFVRGDYMTKDNNGNYYLGCNTQYSNGSTDCNIVKVNGSDSVLWNKKYGAGPPLWDDLTSITPLTNGNVMVGSWTYNPYTLPNMHSHTWLFEIDDNGTVVRQWLDSDSTMEAKSLKQTRDGGFIYASKRIIEQNIGDALCHTTVIKLDSMFGKQWGWEGTMLMSSSLGITDIEELPDGDFIVCGNGNYLNPTYNILSVFIMKLRSDGNVIWKNGYTAMDTNGVENFLNDIDVLPDGSYVAVGYVNLPSSVQPTQRQQAWMLKIDSNGCVIENCLVGVEEPSHEPQPTRQIQVYPNPFTADVSIVLKEENLKEATFVITNTLGEVIYRKEENNLASNYTKVLDLSYLPSGVYFVQVQSMNTTVSKRIVKE